MKKKVLSLVLTLSVALSLMIPASLASSDSVYVDAEDYELAVGEETTVWVEVDEDVDVDSYYWKYSGDGEVSMDDDESDEITIEALEAGTVTLTCIVTDEDGETYRDSVEIEITDGALTAVSVSPSSVTLDEGDTKKLTATIKGSCDEENVYFEWYSGDEDVAYIYSTASGYGRDSVTIKAESYDSCKIYCEATYDGDTVEDYCIVYVDSEDDDTLTDVDIGSNISLDVGDSDTIKATVSGGCDRDDVTFTWTSSDTSVASLSSSGGTGDYSVKVTGKQSGTATITCKAKYDGETATDTLKVTVSGDSEEFYVSSDLPSSSTTDEGTNNTLSFTLKNTTGYTASYQWYVDGSRNSASSTNSFNTSTLSAGVHTVYCEATANSSNYSAKTGTCCVVVNSIESINNFKTQYTYNSQFTDVSSNEWYAAYVQTAYEYGLVNGKNTTYTFCPDEYFTLAEAMKIAACIHSIYYTGSETALTEAASSPDWYTVYVDYCVNNGIVEAGDFPDVTQNCTRAQMAYIFSRCLPDTELTSVREVNIPDCDSSTPYYSNIQTLYKAGIVSGNEVHNYNPNDPIKRSEAVKILCTLTVPSTRDQTVF